MRLFRNFGGPGIVLVLAGTFGSLAHAADATPEALVDALNVLFGKHHMRSSHAKGVCVKGSFTPTAEATTLSKAPQFAKPVPILARFSMPGGNPKITDKAKAPRGFAIRFDPDGTPSDFVLLAAPMFFARTPEQMLGFLTVRAPGPEGKPDGDKIKAFAEANPETGKQGAFVEAHGVPASYTTSNYWGIHAFTLTNASGAKINVKFKAVPAEGEVTLSDDDLKSKSDDFLSGELTERLGKGPAAFNLMAILGEAGDPLDDPTAEWPEAERKSVNLGKIEVSGSEEAAKCDAGTFDPLSLADGIEGPKDDKIYPLRSPAYAVSFSRRN